MNNSPWQLIRLGDERSAVLDRGVSWSKKDESDEGVPVVAIPNIRSGQIDYDCKVKLSCRVSPNKMLQKGDILLVGASGALKNVGRSAIVRQSPKERVAFASFVARVRPVSDFNSYFLAYALQSPIVDYELHSKKAADGKFNLQIESLRDQEIPVPSRPEQEKIAAVLWKIQRAIEVEEKLMATARELKQAAMRQIFTRGLRGEAQQETEIGPMPESWALRPLEELREFLQYGTSTKCDYTKQGNPVLRIPNILGGDIDARDLKWCRLSAKEVESWVLEQGDVLFIRTNGVRERVGTCAVYHGQPERALFASYLIRARLKRDELNPDFFQYFSNTPVGRAQLAGRASPAADGKFNVNTKHIDAVLVPLPPEHEEQDEIVKIIQAIDRKISLHERKQAALQDLFKTMLHKLMTGEIRMADFEIDTSEVTA